MEILGLLIGILVGSVFTYFILKSRVSNSKEIHTLKEEKQRFLTEWHVLKSQNEGVKLDLKAERATLAEERSKNLLINRQLSSVESDYRNLKIKLDEQKKELSNLQKQFKDEFKNLAQEIFEEKSKRFTDQNKTNLGELLNPLRERIEKFEQKVEKSNKDNLIWNSALKEQISSLKELNQQITKEAVNLTKALKGDSKTQGNWGEMQLEAILEKVGLLKDVHYEKEKTFKDIKGANQRVDYIIKLPDDKYLVLDAKVSLTAYSNYFDADDEGKKIGFLKSHLDSIYSHIKTLGAKNYQNLDQINQPDYVLMFVANEPALTIALKEDQSLYEKALDKNIVLVSTTTLMATLRTISYLWKQDLQNKNAIEIATQAGALYDKFSNFTEDLKKVGSHLQSSQNSYADAMNKLHEGKGNLIRRTEKLRELGAKTTKNIDKVLLDRSQA